VPKSMLPYIAVRRVQQTAFLAFLATRIAL